MNIPNGLYYTKDHEWIKVEGNEGTIGITDFAQKELGDIVFLDLPDVGTEFGIGKPFGTIEAVKAVADLYSPITGEITAVNGLLDHQPELIHQSPYGDGWIVRLSISDTAELDTLMDADAYKEYLSKSTGA